MIYATIIFSKLYAGNFEKGKKYEIKDIQRQCENEWVYIIKDEKGSLCYVPDWRIEAFYDGETLKILSKDPYTIYNKFKADKDQKDTIDGSYIKAGRDRRAEAYQAIIDHKNGEKDLRIQILQDQIKELKFKLELEKDMNEKLIARVLRLEELLYDPNI